MHEDFDPKFGTRDMVSRLMLIQNQSRENDGTHDIPYVMMPESPSPCEPYQADALTIIPILLPRSVVFYGYAIEMAFQELEEPFICLERSAWSSYIYHNVDTFLRFFQQKRISMCLSIGARSHSVWTSKGKAGYENEQVNKCSDTVQEGRGQ